MPAQAVTRGDGGNGGHGGNTFGGGIDLNGGDRCSPGGQLRFYHHRPKVAPHLRAERVETVVRACIGWRRRRWWHRWSERLGRVNQSNQFCFRWQWRCWWQRRQRRRWRSSWLGRPGRYGRQRHGWSSLHRSGRKRSDWRNDNEFQHGCRWPRGGRRIWRSRRPTRQCRCRRGWGNRRTRQGAGTSRQHGQNGTGRKVCLRGNGRYYRRGWSCGRQFRCGRLGDECTGYGSQAAHITSSDTAGFHLGVAGSFSVTATGAFGSSVVGVGYTPLRRFSIPRPAY